MIALLPSPPNVVPNEFFPPNGDPNASGDFFILRLAVIKSDPCAPDIEPGQCTHGSSSSSANGSGSRWNPLDGAELVPHLRTAMVLREGVLNGLLLLPIDLSGVTSGDSVRVPARLLGNRLGNRLPPDRCTDSRVAAVGEALRAALSAPP